MPLWTHCVALHHVWKSRASITMRNKDIDMKTVLKCAVVALGAAIAVLAAPAAQAAGPVPEWPLCGAFSLFSKDECAAIKYCLNDDDHACQQAGSQPSNPPRQSGGY